MFLFQGNSIVNEEPRAKIGVIQKQGAFTDLSKAKCCLILQFINWLRNRKVNLDRSDPAERIQELVYEAKPRSTVSKLRYAGPQSLRPVA